MATEFRFPDLGEGLTEGEILRWTVKPGDRVEAHQPILEVETDKAVLEVPSPVKGTVLSLKGGPGDILTVGEVIATLDETGEASTPSPEPRKAPEPAAKLPSPTEPAAPYELSSPSVGVVGTLEEAVDEAAEREAPGVGPFPAPTPARVEALPKDRELARRLGVDIERIHGTGRKGRVTESDVRRAARLGAPERGGPPPEASPGADGHGSVRRVPLRGLRRRIARSMVESLSRAAQVTTMDEADVDALWDIREKLKAQAREQGTHLTVLAFLVKAAAGALLRVPEMNASLDDERQELVFKSYVNIGIAVDTQDGLIVPNVKDADRKTVLEIARELEDLSQRARRRTIEVKDLQGGTFTLTNYGSIGGTFGTPIIDMPEAGILGVGRAEQKPVAEDGAIRIRRRLPLSLTFDHRIVDGAHAQHFLNDIIRHVEDPDLLLVGI